MRPPFALPAKIGSANSITLPGKGIWPSNPTLKVTVRVSSCSDFKAHKPARCACPRDVQPQASSSSKRTCFISEMAFSSRTNSYSVL